MDAGAIAAILTGLAGLFAFFFGRHYWNMLNTMVFSQTNEIERLQTIIRAMRDRLDKVEHQLYGKEIELHDALGRMDDYVAMSQSLSDENKKLREENKALWVKMRELDLKVGC